MFTSWLCSLLTIFGSQNVPLILAFGSINISWRFPVVPPPIEKYKGKRPKRHLVLSDMFAGAKHFLIKEEKAIEMCQAKNDRDKL